MNGVNWCNAGYDHGYKIPSQVYLNWLLLKLLSGVALHTQAQMGGDGTHAMPLLTRIRKDF